VCLAQHLSSSKTSRHSSVSGCVLASQLHCMSPPTTECVFRPHMADQSVACYVDYVQFLHIHLPAILLLFGPCTPTAPVMAVPSAPASILPLAWMLRCTGLLPTGGGTCPPLFFHDPRSRALSSTRMCHPSARQSHTIFAFHSALTAVVTPPLGGGGREGGGGGGGARAVFLRQQ
jgi:hypothetical protein